MGKKVIRGNVIVLVTFCWKTLKFRKVFVTLHLPNISADLAKHYLEKVFFDSSNIFHQHNASDYNVCVVRE